MIGRIQGRLLEKTPPVILIDCNGVGYEVEVPMTTFYELPDIGDEITLLDMAANQYMVKGVLTANGTEATPFSAAVS